MPATHGRSNFQNNRDGVNPVVHSWRVNYNTSGIASGKKLGRIKASSAKPVLVKVWCWLITTFNAGTTNAVTIGTDAAAADQWLSGGDILEANTGHQPTFEDGALQTWPIHKEFLLTSNTDVYAKYVQTGTAATTGQIVFFVQAIEVNTQKV